VIVRRLIKAVEDAGVRFTARVQSPAVRLPIYLPALDPAAIRAPRTCRHGCGGRRVNFRRVVAELLRDTKRAASPS
jgi:hypothetical protein